MLPGTISTMQEPVRTLQGVRYIQAVADTVDFTQRTVNCVKLYKHFEVLKKLSLLNPT